MMYLLSTKQKWELYNMFSFNTNLPNLFMQILTYFESFVLLPDIMAQLHELW